MLRSISLVLALASLQACVPDADPGVQSQSTQVVMVGSFASSGGTTDIYFGSLPAPIGKTEAKGSYRVELPRALLEKETDRRLYFYSSTGETGASEEIGAFDLGEKTIPAVTLSTPIEFTGLVESGDETNRLPIKDAIVRIGRLSATTDASGRYSIAVPRNATLPVEVQSRGYVLTKARWSSQEISEERNFPLFSQLKPLGKITLPTRERDLLAKSTSVSLNLARTPSASKVRISTAPFTTPPALDAGWQSTDKPLSISTTDLAKGVLYYQFSDENFQRAREVFRLELSSN